MAQKRMFDKKVVCSDKFIDLPNSTKALYFMAGMEADDKGFFQPRRLQRMCGFSEDDFKLLIAKRYFIAFESGVMVVTDWNKNNWLDNRRITETEYIDELNLLKLINEKYELSDTCLANAKPMLSEKRIEEKRREENSSLLVEQIIAFMNELAGTSFSANTKKTKSLINARLQEGFTLDDFKDVINYKYYEWYKNPITFGNGVKSDKYYRPNTLFSTKFEEYLEQYKKEYKEHYAGHL